MYWRVRVSASECEWVSVKAAACEWRCVSVTECERMGVWACTWVSAELVIEWTDEWEWWSTDKRGDSFSNCLEECSYMGNLSWEMYNLHQYDWSAMGGEVRFKYSHHCFEKLLHQGHPNWVVTSEEYSYHPFLKQPMFKSGDKTKRKKLHQWLLYKPTLLQARKCYLLRNQPKLEFHHRSTQHKRMAQREAWRKNLSPHKAQ